MGSNLALAAHEAFPGAEVVSLDNLHRRGSELNLPRLRQAGSRFRREDVRRLLADMATRARKDAETLARLQVP